MVSERTEDYLEAIEMIINDKGYAQVKDVSRVLGIGPSSVTEMLQKLDRTGYINYEKYGGVTLTPKGKRVARETRKKHEMLHEFLLILGVEDKTADEDACKMEHDLNPRTLERLTRFVEFVNNQEDAPRWLDHFRYYYRTGKRIDCTRETRDGCPVHGRKGKKKKK